MTDFYAEKKPKYFLFTIFIFNINLEIYISIYGFYMVAADCTDKYKQFLGQPFTIYGLICSVTVIINIEEGV